MVSEEGSLFYEVYEVFSKKTDTSALQHQFSLLAPHEELAFIMAKENFFRREQVADIWVVQRGHIQRMSQEEKESMNQ